MKWKAMIRKYK